MALKKYILRGISYVLHGVPEMHVKANISMLAPNVLLDGRTALITGGTSGIGYGIAEAFLNAGANVIITGRDQERVSKSVRELGHKGRVYGIVMDNTDIAHLESKFRDCENLIGDQEISILVNNAGILGGEFKESTLKQYDDIMNTNLRGSFFLSQIVANYMKGRGIKGNILNICSSSSLRPAASAYTISKWGLRGLTEGLAKLLIPYGIVVNGLAPGPSATRVITNDTEELSFPSNPTGRLTTITELGNMAVILTSNMCRTVVGDIVYMTGGSGIITLDDVNYKF